MVGELFYRGGKVANVNYVGYDIVATFRNADAELVSGNVISIDYCIGKVPLNSPAPIIKHQKRGEIRTQASPSYGYTPGEIPTPNHPATSAIPWMHSFTGTCSTSTDNTKTFTEGNSAYYYAYQFEMESTSYPIRMCALGCYRKHYRFEWSQEDSCQHSYLDGVSKVIATSADITRPTTHDFRAPFPAGQFSSTFAYDSDSLGIVVLAGYFDRTIEWKVHKVGDLFVTDVIKSNIIDEIGFTFRAFVDTTINDLPEEPGSYATALTWYGKWWKDSTSDYLAISATNLWVDKKSVRMEKIDDAMYLYEGTMIAYPCGERTSVTANIFTLTAVDDLSSTRYEGA